MIPCKECDICCVSMRIEAIAKPAGERCPNLTGDGCGIHRTKPQECQLFNCIWRRGLIDWKYRPDQCGLLFYENQKKNTIAETIKKFPKVRVYTVREAWFGAIEKEENGLIEELDKRSVVVILMRDDGTRRIYGNVTVVTWMMEQANMRKEKEIALKKKVV